MAEAIREGRGVGWHEHHHDLYQGTERFFRPNYIGNLVGSWIPRWTAWKTSCGRSKVADVGCGYGASTIIMAKEYPNSTFVGFDYHEGSVDGRPEGRDEAGVEDRCSFEVASAKDTQARTTISWRSSIPSTTWGIPSGSPLTCSKPSTPTAPG